MRVITALGFKIDDEKAIAFQKWANQIVTEYTIKGWVMDDQRLKDGTPIADRYFDHLLEKIREIRVSAQVPLTPAGRGRVRKVGSCW